MTAAPNIPSELRPLPDSQFGADQARHLMARAGFGGTPQQVRAIAELGAKRAVARLVDHEQIPFADDAEKLFDSDIIRPPTDEERQEIVAARRSGDESVQQKLERERNRRQAADRQQMLDIQKWWLQRMIESPRPLEEKMTLFWHGHFASGFRTVQDSWHMLQQNRLFRKHGTGNFAQLVRAVVRDPAMIKYLDNDQNRKGRPNENLARELMELFTLGEGRGYTEGDIKEGARALTGLTFRDDEGRFETGSHDAGSKTIFGFTGTFDPDGFVDLILARRECPEFVCGKLYRFFVNDCPDGFSREQQAVVNAMSRMLVDAKAELKPVLRALFASEHFHAPANRGAIIKSPVQLVVQSVRQFRAPPRQLSVLLSACDLMGQNVFQPPNVKGWDGGRAWINTSTLFTRQNLLVYLLTGRSPKSAEWDANADPFDAAALVAEARATDGTVPLESGLDWLLRCTLATPVTAQRRAEVLQGLRDRQANLGSNAGIVETLCLVTAIPEFQLC